MITYYQNLKQQCFQTKTQIKILAGTYQQQSSNAPIMSPMTILHVTVQNKQHRKLQRQLQQEQSQSQAYVPTSTEGGWTYDIPNNYDTIILYIRKGPCKIITTTTHPTQQTILQNKQIAPMHTTVVLQQQSQPPSQQPYNKNRQETLIITPIQPNQVVDVLVLAGQPLYETYTTTMTTTTNTNTNGRPNTGRDSDSQYSTTLEPVSMQGSMVMNYPHEIEQAYQDYQMGKMGRPWSHTLADDEWKQHVQRFPSVYQDVDSILRRRRRSRRSDDDDDDIGGRGGRGRMNNITTD
jgi:redox-sensitive bicupin YhaK (pirin superfamily)